MLCCRYLVLFSLFLLPFVSVMFGLLGVEAVVIFLKTIYHLPAYPAKIPKGPFIDTAVCIHSRGIGKAHIWHKTHCGIKRINLICLIEVYCRFLEPGESDALFSESVSSFCGV